jgi:hypothetical protein
MHTLTNTCKLWILNNKIIISKCSITKTVQHWAIYSTILLLFILSALSVQTFVCICVFKIGLVQTEHVKCIVSNGALGLYSTAMDSTVCFTLGRLISGARRCVDTKGKINICITPVYVPAYRLNSITYLKFISRQRNDQSKSWPLNICRDKTKFFNYCSCC